MNISLDVTLFIQLINLERAADVCFMNRLIMPVVGR